MIPSIFISSTIGDLRYLRDALRDAVLDLAYQPIMSEHGEVGYLSPTTAAESCYRSIRQCQMAVVIVGRRYGNPSEEGGISVTHKEFRTAREHGIPLIGFVEAQVLAYRDVFKANSNPIMWKNFQHMDHPELSFSLIDEITSAESYNGLIPFANVAEAKQALKLQIADFVGQSLSQVISPMRAEIKDVLAEIKTLRHELAGQRKFDPDFLAALRFILDDRHAQGYRYLLEHTVGPLDKAIPMLIASKTFEEFVAMVGYQLVVSADIDVLKDGKADPKMMGAMAFHVPWGEGPNNMAKAEFMVCSDRRLVMNKPAKGHFDWVQEELRMQTGTEQSGGEVRLTATRSTASKSLIFRKKGNDNGRR